ncbi:hypothetical protein [Flavobacterium sp.]|uniref:hypothetical protein n=1 Tax=Flavobacterium sp. TaxID=239 RepID=UPI00375138BD
MTTLTIKIDKRSKAGKSFMVMSETFFKGVDGIEVIEQDSNKTKKSNKSLTILNLLI